jgi:hypothetical protein
MGLCENKAHKNIYKGVKFCTRQTIIKRSIYQRAHEKLSIKESTGNLALDSGAYDKKKEKRKSI